MTGRIAESHGVDVPRDLLLTELSVPKQLVKAVELERVGDGGWIVVNMVRAHAVVALRRVWKSGLVLL
jgi:hypothetical protein